MKTFRNVLAIALLLCALTAFLSVGALADGMNQTVIGVGTVNVSAPIPEEHRGKIVQSYEWSIESSENLVHLENKGRDSAENALAAVTTLRNVNAAYWIKCEYTFTDASTVTVEGRISQTAASVLIDQGALGLTVGEGYQLTATSNTGSVDWVSDNPAVVSVVNGYVTGVGEGTATITASSCGASDTRAITVYPLAPTPTPTPTPTPAPDPTITLTPETMSLVSGNSGYLRADVGNVTGKNVLWTSSSNVTVSPSTSTSGSSVMVTARSGVTTSETATVTATVEGTSISKTCTVTITPNGVKHINVTADNYYPKVGETITVTANIEYSTPGDQITEWKFDSSILQCTELGTTNYVKFKALKAGSSKVTAVSGTAETYIDITVGGGQTINHQITYGNYATFDGSNPLNFITNEYISNFKGVTVDGYALTNGNQYYAQSSSDGHILVTMNPAYLKLLSSANYHTIQIYSTVNQPATGYFRNYGVSQTIYGVRTGDDNNIALWVTLCVIGFAGAAAIVIAKRKDIFGKCK